MSFDVFIQQLRLCLRFLSILSYVCIWVRKEETCTNKILYKTYFQTPIWAILRFASTTLRTTLRDLKHYSEQPWISQTLMCLNLRFRRHYNQRNRRFRQHWYARLRVAENVIYLCLFCFISFFHYYYICHLFFLRYWKSDIIGNVKVYYIINFNFSILF